MFAAIVEAEHGIDCDEDPEETEKARFVLKYAPDLADQVLKEFLPLRDALTTALHNREQRDDQTQKADLLTHSRISYWNGGCGTHLAKSCANGRSRPPKKVARTILSSGTIR